jgi:hypothetical protein
MLPVKRHLAMNTFCRSMTYYQKSYSLQLKGLRPLLIEKGLQYTVHWFKEKHKICHLDHWSSKPTLKI